MADDKAGNCQQDNIVVCDACPVLCRIREGRAGACDRYANRDGRLMRVDPVTMIRKTLSNEGEIVPFLSDAEDWDGDILPRGDLPDRHRVRHHLSGLQTRALHRVQPA